MSEQTPTNISNADFTFKDKYGNTGSNKGLSANDGTKLNNMVKLLNLLLNTPNSTDFINTLATKQYVDENIELLDVGEVTEALTSKADTTLANASNVAQSFKDMSIGWGMPDYSAVLSITLPYTAPSDGYLFFTPGDNYGHLWVNSTFFIESSDNGAGLNCQTGMILVRKNDVITKDGFDPSNTRFVPCKGAN